MHSIVFRTRAYNSAIYDTDQRIQAQNPHNTTRSTVKEMTSLVLLKGTISLCNAGNIACPLVHNCAA